MVQVTVEVDSRVRTIPDVEQAFESNGGVVLDFIEGDRNVVEGGSIISIKEELVE